MLEFVKTAEMPAAPVGSEAAVVARIEKLKTATGKEKIADIRTELQDEMMDKASVFRTEETLSSVLDTVRDLSARYENVSIDDKGNVFNYDLTEALELSYLLDLAESLVVSARARTESRGAHFRDDYPTRNDVEWMQHSLATRNDDGTVKLSYKPVVGGPYEPMERKY